MTGRSVAVVGGGVIGCAVARELAPDHDVTLLEQGDLAGEASALAAGEVTMAASYADRPAIADWAIDFFRSYDGTGAFEFHELEGLGLIPPEHEGAARRRAARQAEDGIDVEFLEPATVEERYPRIDCSPFAGGVVYHETGFLDPYTLTTTLAADAVDLGADVRTDTRVEGIAVGAGAVEGVETADGSVPADVVVAAAGWRTPDVVAQHLEVPVRPYRTQCVVLEPTEPVDGAVPMGWLPEEHVYFRPELNGDLLVGGWSFAEDDPLGASRDADEEFRDHVAEVVPRFLRDFDRAGFVDGWAGIDGATPDTRPVIDAPADAPEGLVVATGFHGRGVMTSPVAAAAVRAIVEDAEAPFPLEEFAIDRFDSRSREFPFHSISAS